MICQSTVSVQRNVEPSRRSSPNAADTLRKGPGPPRFTKQRKPSHNKSRPGAVKKKPCVPSGDAADDTNIIGAVNHKIHNRSSYLRTHDAFAPLSPHGKTWGCSFPAFRRSVMNRGLTRQQETRRRHSRPYVNDAHAGILYNGRRPPGSSAGRGWGQKVLGVAAAFLTRNEVAPVAQTGRALAVP